METKSLRKKGMAMTDFDRKAGVLWKADLKSGLGLISTESRALFELPYSYRTRFEDEEGLNPEGLLAAGHAACFCIAVAERVEENGYKPVETETKATCTVAPKNGGHEITKMRLHVRGEVPGIDEATFKRLAMQADKECLVSDVLRHGLKIEITTALT